jgi:hypothetical protein
MGELRGMLTSILPRMRWQGALLGTLLFVVSFAISLAIVSIILVRIPSDYFQEGRPHEFWSGRDPAIRLLGIIGKNVLGVLLVALGIVMSIPGVPGQGLLTILLGIMLLDFPGRQKLERRIVSQPRVLKNINKLRHRFSKPELVL